MATFNTPLFNTSLFNGSGSGGGNPNPPAAPLVKVSDLIYKAYRIAGVLEAAQRGVSPSETLDGLLWLNTMVAAWKAERTMVPAIVRSLFTLVPGKGNESSPYLIGLDTQNGTPDFLIDRPTRIEACGLVFAGTNPAVETPVRMLVDPEYQALSPKDISGAIPTFLYYRPLVPNGVLILWPVPTVANFLALYTWQALSLFTSPDDPVITPPEYFEALEYNLALRIAEIFPTRQKMAPSAVKRAADSLGRIKTVNAPQLRMQVESAARQHRGNYNIFSNRPRP